MSRRPGRLDTPNIALLVVTGPWRDRCGGRHALTEVERKATPGADRLPGEPAAADVRAGMGRADDSSRLQPMRRPHLTSHAGQDNEQIQ